MNSCLQEGCMHMDWSTMFLGIMNNAPNSVGKEGVGLFVNK